MRKCVTNAHVMGRIFNPHTWKDLSNPVRVFLSASLSLSVLHKERVETQRDQMLECLTMHTIKPIPSRIKEGAGGCVIYTTVQGLSQNYQPRCRHPTSCSRTACNESNVSEPWHAQMINWWQRELIKEIKLGTQ